MTQCERIIKYINDFGGISNAEAITQIGVGSLSRQITTLRRKGYRITAKTVKGKNRYGEPTHWTVYGINNNEE